MADVFLILNISEELSCSVIEKNSLTAASSSRKTTMFAWVLVKGFKLL